MDGDESMMGMDLGLDASCWDIWECADRGGEWSQGGLSSRRTFWSPSQTFQEGLSQPHIVPEAQKSWDFEASPLFSMPHLLPPARKTLPRIQGIPQLPFSLESRMGHPKGMQKVRDWEDPTPSRRGDKDTGEVLAVFPLIRKSRRASSLTTARLRGLGSGKRQYWNVPNGSAALPKVTDTTRGQGSVPRGCRPLPFPKKTPPELLEIWDLPRPSRWDGEGGCGGMGIPRFPPWSTREERPGPALVVIPGFRLGKSCWEKFWVWGSAPGAEEKVGKSSEENPWKKPLPEAHPGGSAIPTPGGEARMEMWQNPSGIAGNARPVHGLEGL